MKLDLPLFLVLHWSRIRRPQQRRHLLMTRLPRTFRTVVPRRFELESKNHQGIHHGVRPINSAAQDSVVRPEPGGPVVLTRTVPHRPTPPPSPLQPNAPTQFAKNPYRVATRECEPTFVRLRHDLDSVLGRHSRSAVDLFLRVLEAFAQ